MTGTVAHAVFAKDNGTKRTTGTAKHALANAVSAEKRGKMGNTTGTVAHAVSAKDGGTKGTTGTAKHALANAVSAEKRGRMGNTTGTVVSVAFADKCEAQDTTGTVAHAVFAGRSGTKDTTGTAKHAVANAVSAGYSVAVAGIHLRTGIRSQLLVKQYGKETGTIGYRWMIL